MPSPHASPAGIEKRAIARRNPSGRHGPLDGASASRNAGIPIVKVEGRVNWRGSIGKTPLGIAITSTRKAVKTALETKRRATRWMLRRIWRPSPTIGGTSPNSPDTSTRSDTDRAPWVPLPWAIARRGPFRPGTSFAHPPHPGFLALGEDPPDPRGGADRLEQLGVVLGQVAAVEGRAGGLDSEV